MTTYSQDEDFLKAVVGGTALLEKAIDWIKDNLGPDEVFDESELQAWAKDNGFVEEE